jgi:hypothetical protein
MAKKRDNEMKNEVVALVTLCVLSLVAGCSTSSAPATALQTDLPPPIDALETVATPDQVTDGSAPACPPARGEGTISPAISIYSVVFVVNGIEQVVRAGDILQVSTGEEVQVREVTICVGSYSGNGGEACVDFVPVAQSGQEIVSEHSGTHNFKVTPGFMSISGLERGWMIGENWRYFSIVLNHWPPVSTEDFSCGSGRCEHDDRLIIELQ